jgi:hypothetical protein
MEPEHTADDGRVARLVRLSERKARATPRWLVWAVVALLALSVLLLGAVAWLFATVERIEHRISQVGIPNR